MLGNQETFETNKVLLIKSGIVLAGYSISAFIHYVNLNGYRFLPTQLVNILTTIDSNDKFIDLLDSAYLYGQEKLEEFLDVMIDHYPSIKSAILKWAASRPAFLEWLKESELRSLDRKTQSNIATPDNILPLLTTHNLESLHLADINRIKREQIFVTQTNHALVINEYARYLIAQRKFYNPYTNLPLSTQDVKRLLDNPIIKDTVRLHRIQTGSPQALVTQYRTQNQRNPAVARSPMAQVRHRERLERRTRQRPY